MTTFVIAIVITCAIITIIIVVIIIIIIIIAIVIIIIIIIMIIIAIVIIMVSSASAKTLAHPSLPLQRRALAGTSDHVLGVPWLKPSNDHIHQLNPE